MEPLKWDDDEEVCKIAVLTAHNLLDPVGNVYFSRYTGIGQNKKTPNILASIFERVSNNQNLTFRLFTSWCSGIAELV